MSARRDEWTEYELQLLYEVVNDIEWFPKVAGVIDRSPAAIRTKMSNLRCEAGIIPKQIGPRSKSRSAAQRDDVAVASARLRDAMVRLKTAERALEKAA